MKKIVIATSNEKKLNEIKALLSDISIEIIPQSDLGIESCKESFNTFIENALIKARFASKETNLPAIADDSGLCVDSLNGQPGVFSARFAGEKKNDEDNNNKLGFTIYDILSNNKFYSKIYSGLFAELITVYPHLKTILDSRRKHFIQR